MKSFVLPGLPHSIKESRKNYSREVCVVFERALWFCSPLHSSDEESEASHEGKLTIIYLVGGVEAMGLTRAGSTIARGCPVFGSMYSKRHLQKTFLESQKERVPFTLVQKSPQGKCTVHPWTLCKRLSLDSCHVRVHLPRGRWSSTSG